MERPPCLRLDKFSQLAGLPRPTILESLSWEICLIRPPANSKRLQTGEREPVTSQPPCCRTAPCSWLAAKSQEYFVVSAGRPWFPLLRQSCSTAAQRRFLLLLACPFPDSGTLQLFSLSVKFLWREVERLGCYFAVADAHAGAMFKRWQALNFITRRQARLLRL